MNVAELRKQLDGVPDDTIIVLSRRDHDYRQVRQLKLTTALKSKGNLSEDFSEDYPSEGERVQILFFE